MTRAETPPDQHALATRATGELLSVCQDLKISSPVTVIDCTVSAGEAAGAGKTVVVLLVDSACCRDGLTPRSELAGRLTSAAAAVLEGRAVLSSLPSDNPGSAGERRELTRREFEITQLIASGLTNKSIAERLAISVRTVESHRGSLRRKLGVRSTATLVHWAMRHGLPHAASGD